MGDALLGWSRCRRLLFRSMRHEIGYEERCHLRLTQIDRGDRRTEFDCYRNARPKTSKLLEALMNGIKDLERTLNPLVNRVIQSELGQSLFIPQFTMHDTLRLVSLSDEALVMKRESETLIHQGHLLKLLDDHARAELSAQQLIDRSLLYVIHEMIHVIQGVAGLNNVRKIKDVCDRAMLRFDLEADHLAVSLIVASKIIDRSIIDLKREALLSLRYFLGDSRRLNRQSRSISSRKLERILSLSLELMKRRVGSLSDNAFYIFHLSGPSWSLISHNQTHQEQLSAGSLSKSGLEKVRSLITQCSSDRQFETYTREATDIIWTY